MSLRVVFMGSPEFALPSFKRLTEEYSVVGVVTQPDRPAGRGMALTPPPVKRLADRLGIPVIQPLKMKDPPAWEQLQSWQPDLVVVAAFSKILRQNVLDLPPRGCINVHASLLPRWRGAAPIQAAILNGDPVTGITIMRMDAGLDTGMILAQRQELIRGDDTADSLGRRLADLGAALLVETLPQYLSGELCPEPQDDSLATYAPMIKKEEGLLDFLQPAQALAWKVRAFHSWPGAYFEWPGGILKVHRARAIDPAGGNPGERRSLRGFPAVVCREGWLVLEEVQPAGKKSMAGDVFLRGARQWAS
jgi:methionyl-tRNA formyltransferase